MDKDKHDQISIMCPKCFRVSPQTVFSGGSVYIFACPKCSLEFTSQFVTIRAMRSRYIKFAGRSYNIRYYNLDGTEGSLDFLTKELSKMEFKAKDKAIFSYHNKTLVVAQNLTVNQNYKLSVPTALKS